MDFFGIMGDPFYVVKEEVEQSISGVTSLFDRWKMILQNTDTSQNEEFQWTAEELKKGIKTIEWDLNDLEETIKVVESSKDKFGITTDELSKRKQFIQKTKDTVQQIKNAMNSPETRTKIENDKRQNLIPKKQPSDRWDKLKKEMENDNERFLQEQQMQQQEIFSEQDKNLDILKDSVSRMKNYGEVINDTMQEHFVLIEEVESGVEKVDSGLKGMIKKVDNLIDRTKDSTQWCIIITLILILVGLLVAVFYV